MNTLFAIEEFSMKTMEASVWKSYQAHQVDLEEKYQQLRVLAKLQSTKLMDELLKKEIYYPVFLYKEILRRYQTSYFDQIVSLYDETCDDLKRAILSLFAEKKDTSYIPLIERELENGHLDIRIANGCEIERGEVMKVGLSKRPLIIMQVIEYLRAFQMGRIGLSRHNLLLIVSGAFRVFHKEWVVKAGGYRTKTVGEDMELVDRLHRILREEKSTKRIEYVPDPVCWTEAPESLKILRRQRSRWHRGLFESLWLHKKMIGNPKYGMVGLISMPYFLLIELLSAVIEFIGYFIVVIGLVFSLINVQIALLLLFLMSFLYGSILSMSAVLLEEWSLRKYELKRDIIRLFLYSLSEAFWYRPLTVFWRFEGFMQALLKRKSNWGEMTRKGISK